VKNDLLQDAHNWSASLNMGMGYHSIWAVADFFISIERTPRVLQGVLSVLLVDLAVQCFFDDFITAVDCNFRLDSGSSSKSICRRSVSGLSVFCDLLKHPLLGTC